MIYLHYIIFCIKALFHLRKNIEFLEYNGSKPKNYRVELKNINNKIKMARKRDLQPKKDHVFLSEFYTSMHMPENERKDKFLVLFTMAFLWQHTLISTTVVEPSQEKE